MVLTHWIATGLILAATPMAAAQQQMTDEAAPEAAVDRTTTADEIAIRTDADERMTVPVSVSGRGPYRFLVDTGSERTVISRELASKLSLQRGRVTLLHSVMGSKDVNTVFIPDLRVSGQVMSVANAPALEPQDIGADGLLGVDSLQSQRVMFDFKANTMTIVPANAPVSRIEGNTIVVRAKSRGGRLIFTHARVEGRKIAVIVDTGSQITIANPAMRNMLAKRDLLKVPDAITVSSVTGEKMEAQVSILGKLEIGGVEMTELAVAYVDAPIFKELNLDDKPAMLLGMNAIKAFDRVSIDFASKKVRFVLPGTSMRQPVRMASVGGI